MSNQRLGDPCSIGHTAGSLVQTCGSPLKRHLARGSILASWWIGGGMSAGWFRLLKGADLTVGGHRAKITTTDTGCPGVGGDLTMQVDVDNLFSFHACIRGPGAGALEIQTKALLQSVRFVR
jgi:hypothetical protein